jgi:hypothetical protein
VKQSFLVVAWEEETPYCCKLLRSNVEFIVRKSLASKDVNTETEEATALAAVTRQPVKTQQNEKTNVCSSELYSV